MKLDLDKLLSEQEKFNKQILDICFDSEDIDKVSLVRDFISGIITNAAKLNEYLGSPHYKVCLEDRDQILEELIDIFKFWGNLVNTLGFKTDDINRKFIEKSLISVNRAKVDIKLRKDLASGKIKKLAIVDIDGVLFPYPKMFYEFCRSKYGITEDEIRKLQIEDIVAYTRLKTEYRHSDIKRTCPPLPNAKEALEKLKDEGYTIMILSRRLRVNFVDTIIWLEKFSLPYEYLYFADVLRDRGSKGDVLDILFTSSGSQHLEEILIIDDSRDYLSEMVSTLKAKGVDIRSKVITKEAL